MNVCLAYCLPSPVVFTVRGCHVVWLASVIQARHFGKEFLLQCYRKMARRNSCPNCYTIDLLRSLSASETFHAVRDLGSRMRPWNGTRLSS